MDMFYKRTNSKRNATTWINSLIKLNLELHLSEWKRYYNLIQEVTPNNSNNQSQLHQDMVHEVSTLQKHAKDITYFGVKYKLVSQMDRKSKKKNTIRSPKEETR